MEIGTFWVIAESILRNIDLSTILSMVLNDFRFEFKRFLCCFLFSLFIDFLFFHKKTVCYCLAPVEVVSKYLVATLESTDAVSEDHLYEMSLKREPRGAQRGDIS